MDTEQIIRKYIDKTIHMSLGTTRNDKPWVCEVHFVYDTDINLYYRSIPARRHSQEIAGNPNVAGNIVGQHARGEYPHAIYFEGKAELVTDTEFQKEILLPLFIDRLASDPLIFEDAQKDEGHKFYKITVENWYTFGKFGSDKGSKTKLEWNSRKD